MSTIDTPFNTESRLACLFSQGVRTVIRYYNFSNSQRFPEKRMELAEAQALAAQGMQIAVVFQQRQDQVSDFTELKGVAAGRRAYRYAQDNIGQPADSGIYFAVEQGQPRIPDYDHEHPAWVENAIVYGVIPRKFG